MPVAGRVEGRAHRGRCGGVRDALADGRNVGRGAKRDSRAGGGVEDRNALAVSDGDVRATGVHGEYRRGGLVHVLAAPRLAGALVIGARARASLGAGRAVLLLALALTLRHRGCRRVAISIQSWAMERYATATLSQWPPLRANLVLFGNTNELTRLAFGEVPERAAR